MNATTSPRRNGWAEAVREIDPAARIDPVADPITMRVDVHLWHSVAAHLHQCGAQVWEWLSAADLPDGLVIALHVHSGRTGDPGVIVTAAVSADQPVTSLTDLWLGAVWHERETTEMFGIAFGPDASMPLLLADHGISRPPLRRRSALDRRVETPWPGRHEPGESDDPVAARARRRPVLPPGVRPEWTGV